MSSYAHRALRATVAAAGMAALGISFVGTAAAATPKANDGPDAADARHSTSDPGHALHNHSPSALDHPDTPGIHNHLVNFELPRVETTAYRTSWRGIPVSHHENNVCHGLGGSQHLPFHNSFQHPCQSHDNSFGKVKYQHDGLPISNHYQAAQPADAPQNIGLVNKSPDPNDVSRDDSSPLLSSFGLHGPTDLDQMNGYSQVGPQPV